MQKKVVVIGAGFAGLSAAALLARDGAEVHVLEAHQQAGGRARTFEAEGFMFDMGPSWYWMPDVFERFFGLFGKKVSDYYKLTRLDPSYQVVFDAEKREVISLPSGKEGLFKLFEDIEPGAGKKLKVFLKEAQYKYEVGMSEFVFKPSHSILEFADLRILSSLFKLEMFTSISKSIRKLFRNPRLIEILEFPVLFLGATPQKTPALYSLMNYADMALGTWYPNGGMHHIASAMTTVCKEQGVHFHFGESVNRIEVSGGKVKAVHSSQGVYNPDAVVAAGDYHHLEQEVLDSHARMYSPKYWESRTMAPSSLLFYLGVDRKVPGLLHHNLFFDEDFSQHAIDIYENPKWPEKPLFYVCCPSVTDQSVAPEGKENIFVLIPLAPDLQGDEDETVRERYYHMVMNRLEAFTGVSIRESVIYKRSYAHREFKADYHAYKGNAYGLANTLFQTAFLKPKLRNPKAQGLFFSGQLTTPGPGVPPSIISGEVVAKEVMRFLG